LMPDSITAGNIKISTFICYEIAFPEQVMSRNADIGMILTVSDDAWFGHSIAQAQHLQMAQMRAIEMGRPVLSVSNDGLTAAIDEHGFIYAIAPPFEPYVLTTMVQPRTGLTLWQTGGMDPVLLTILLMIVFARRHRFSHF
jgi:apolipoprotein N-acyltransferase